MFHAPFACLCRGSEAGGHQVPTFTHTWRALLNQEDGHRRETTPSTDEETQFTELIDTRIQIKTCLIPKLLTPPPFSPEEGYNSRNRV